MRVILHAGLHKSGTTSLQGSWRHAYADHPDVWYPPPPSGPPGHHRLLRPLVRAFVDGTAPDLAAASVAFHARGGARRTLADVLAAARRRGVATLLLSSEDLDRAREVDREALHAALGNEDVTLVLTATRPTHRWCSGWQTLVKRGLADYPADAARQVAGFAALEHGRLAELASLLPSRRVVVRLVRNAPPEPDLGAAVAAVLGLPDVGREDPHPVLNTSLGVDTEVVLRINRAHLAGGQTTTDAPCSSGCAEAGSPTVRPPSWPTGTPSRPPCSTPPRPSGPGWPGCPGCPGRTGRRAADRPW